MADVAQLAGVSIATVSHVINGTRPVSDGTRNRVEAAIKQIGYRPNAVARALVTATTGTIGVAISSATNPYFGELVRAMETQARASGLVLLVGDTHDDPDIELEVVERLVARQVDGLVLVPSPGAERTSLPFLEELKVPVVLVDRRATMHFDYVIPEGVESTCSLTLHLADLGHTRIGLIRGRDGLSSTADRELGYLKALQMRGLSEEPSLIASGNSTGEGAYAATTALMQSVNPPTALVVANNAMTIGCLRALRDLRLRIAEDVALVCYDDFEWADVFQPELTCVSQDTTQMGAEALQLLLARIGGSTAPIQRREIATTFHHRHSCGCLDNGARPSRVRAPRGS
jgi:LacI family transcriptional regulator